MPCGICQKNRASVHVTEIVNGVQKEIHLCDECARQKGGLAISFSISNLLGNVMEGKMTHSAREEMSGVRCPDCGLTYEEFRKRVRFGCANDYDLFKPGILPLLEKIHGSTRHCGKVPETADETSKRESQVAQLKRELDQAVKDENFEKAAQVRDRIQNLEKEVKGA